MGKDRQTTNRQLFGIQISTILQTLKPERIQNAKLVPRVQFIYKTSWKKCETLSMWYRCYINTKTFFIPWAFYFKYLQRDKMINICRHISFLSNQGADLSGANLLICRLSRGSRRKADSRVGSTSIQYMHTRRSWWFKQFDWFANSDYDVIFTALEGEYKAKQNCCRELGVLPSFRVRTFENTRISQCWWFWR